MTTTLLSILGFSLLFALFGVVLRRRPECGGNCGTCSRGSCDAGNGHGES
jgi:LPXTG-motif cell wall-anchored protein